MNDLLDLEVYDTHPCLESIIKYINFRIYADNFWKESEKMYELAMSGDKKNKICYQTLCRFKQKKFLSDRSMMGLAWLLKEMEENKKRMLGINET